MPASNPFPSDALEANRRGELSDAQRRGFGALSRYRRKSELSTAGFLLAGAILVGGFASPTASVALRVFITLACLAIAAWLVVRSITGSDAITRDLRETQVRSVEGAIGKRRLSGGGGRSVTTLFLDVGDSHFRVAPATYEAAPDAGIVRLYYLSHSRKVVNLERLRDEPLPEHVTSQGILGLLGQMIRSPSRREANEARAGLASIGEALQAPFVHAPAPPPPHARDPRPLREAILGTWANAVLRVTFSADGKVTTDLPGGRQEGHWSADGTEHLCADIMGHKETADAWVVGDQLTIVTAEGGMAFTRAADAGH
jgi:hypothetical protein